MKIIGALFSALCIIALAALLLSAGAYLQSDEAMESPSICGGYTVEECGPSMDVIGTCLTVFAFAGIFLVIVILIWA